MKLKLKQIAIKTASLLCIGLVCGFFLDLFILKAYCFIKNPVPVYEMATINVKGIEIYPEPETPMKKYVLTEIYKAGLNPDEAERIIDCESKWQNDRININNNKTYDAGLWQINSIHKLNVTDALDYKKATRWAINKRLKDGNWSAWVCAKLLALK
jgi:hypothetical protein